MTEQAEPALQAFLWCILIPFGGFVWMAFLYFAHELLWKGVLKERWPWQKPKPPADED